MNVKLAIILLPLERQKHTKATSKSLNNFTKKLTHIPTCAPTPVIYPLVQNAYVQNSMANEFKLVFVYDMVQYKRILT